MDAAPANDNSTFCALCLRRSPSDGSFFGYNIGTNSKFRNTMNAVLGVQLELDDFYTCKSCLKLVQLLQDFRACCLEANVKLKEFGQGVKSDDKWLAGKTAQVIENVRVAVATHAELIRNLSVAVKVEAVEHLEESDASLDEFPSQYIDVKIEESDGEAEPEYLDFTQEMVSDMVEGEILIEEDDDDEIDFSTWIRSSEEAEGSIDTNDFPFEISECSKCNRRFDSLQGMKTHFVQCRGEDDAVHFKHKCPICSVSFRYPALLKTHMNKHDGKSEYKCRKRCNRSFVGSVNRYIHERQCAKEPQKCPICNYDLKSKRALADHMIAVHGEAKHGCGECGMKFRRRSWLTQHRVRLHGASILRTPLNQPVASCSAKPVVPTAESDSQFKCDECGKTFTHRPLMQYHKRRMHPVQS
uniref:Zinc finger protein 689 n=1 Tax=Culex pipiens TaxID=7175 RepID=A0A8D8EZQ6_CULPI